MNKIFLLFSVAATLGCAHGLNVPSETPVIKSKDLISFDEALSDASTAKSPALYEFKKGPVELLYLASNHVTDPKSETFRLIEYAFAKKSFRLIIVEGFETSLGQSPVEIKNAILSGNTKDFYPNGEPSYAVELAVRNGIPFIGGEPNDKQIFLSVKSGGYSVEDLIGFNFVRRIPQLRRQRKVIDMATLESEFKWYSKAKAKDFGVEDLTFNFEAFKKWYSSKQGKNLSLESGEKGETAPMDGPYFTQKLSKIITTARDENIVNTITTMLSTHQKVLIIYGSSHYRIEHKALKNALGEPTENFALP